MRFSENGLYVERYIKCGNCGALIYEKRDQQLLTDERIIYCSQWCIDWKKSRDARRANAREGARTDGVGVKIRCKLTQDAPAR